MWEFYDVKKKVEFSNFPSGGFSVNFYTAEILCNYKSTHDCFLIAIIAPTLLTLFSE